MKTSLILLIASFGVLCGCTSMSPTTSQIYPDTATRDDRVAIGKLLMANAAALNAGDLSALAKFYERDAVQLPPNSPAVIGWKAIRSTLESGFKGIKVTETIQIIELSSSYRWAFARGTYRLVTTPQGGGEPTVATGNWLYILRRQPDDSWKIARSSWSSEEQPSVAAPPPTNTRKTP
jgi:ketosteroid isomerase-like protein